MNEYIRYTPIIISTTRATTLVNFSLLLLLILFIPVKNIYSQIPPPDYNKVAYFVFDSGGPDHYPLTSFTDEANVVVIFEGTLWELADSANYYTGWMTTTNPNYQYYSQILADIRVLQSRGIKVLMNVDDAASWSTSIPFTTYDGIEYDYKQFAEFIKTCAIDSVQLDGISLDIEHRAVDNENYRLLLKELGKYFGPLSSSSESQMYIAAMYNGYWGRPGYTIGRSPDIMSHMNFLMDMAYFDNDFESKFYQWSDEIGSTKTMIGVLNDYFDMDYAVEVARWQPSAGNKAGIMVYAANNLKSYTDSVFQALVQPASGVEDINSRVDGYPGEFAVMQNFPNPFNPSTTIYFDLEQSGFVSLKIFDVLGNEVELLGNETLSPGYYSRKFTASDYASGVYFARLSFKGKDSAPIIKTIKMVLTK